MRKYDSLTISNRDYNAFREHILSAHNIADHERDYLFWGWVEEFPVSLFARVLEGLALQDKTSLQAIRNAIRTLKRKVAKSRRNTSLPRRKV